MLDLIEISLEFWIDINFLYGLIGKLLLLFKNFSCVEKFDGKLLKYNNYDVKSLYFHISFIPVVYILLI